MSEEEFKNKPILFYRNRGIADYKQEYSSLHE